MLFAQNAEYVYASFHDPATGNLIFTKSDIAISCYYFPAFAVAKSQMVT